jgi:hypothetical protein
LIIFELCTWKMKTRKKNMNKNIAIILGQGQMNLLFKGINNKWTKFLLIINRQRMYDLTKIMENNTMAHKLKALSLLIGTNNN